MPYISVPAVQSLHRPTQLVGWRYCLHAFGAWYGTGNGWLEYCALLRRDWFNLPCTTGNVADGTICSGSLVGGIGATQPVAAGYFGAMHRWGNARCGVLLLVLECCSGYYS